MTNTYVPRTLRHRNSQNPSHGVAHLNANPFEDSPVTDKIFRDNRPNTPARIKIDFNHPTITIASGSGLITTENTELQICEGINITNGTWMHKVETNSYPLRLSGPGGEEIVFDGSYENSSLTTPQVIDFQGQPITIRCSNFVVPDGWTIKILPRGANPRWMRRNLISSRKVRGRFIGHVEENEAVAIDTLREMISETEFRKYMKYGFILVQGKSGAIYQVSRNASHTKVWKGGKLIEEVCVRLRDYNIPLTDNVIAFKIMIETDEEEFKKLGNVYKMYII